MMSEKELVAVMKAFGDAFNRHDLDAIMALMTVDCVFDSFAGPDICGTHFEGQDEVRRGFTRIWEVCPDAKFSETRSFISGTRGVSEWLFTGTIADGEYIEVNGCDLFTFRDGKIAVKDAFRKQRTSG
jgi:ketosteroid isomerase-like protein